MATRSERSSDRAAGAAAAGTYWYADVVDDIAGTESKSWESASGGKTQTVDGTTADTPARQWQFGQETLTWDQLMSLPTNSTDLANTIAQAVAAPATQGVTPLPPNDRSFYTAVVLMSSPAPQAVQEAAYQVALSVSGVKDAGAATDKLGRPGEELQYTGAGSIGNWTVIVDSGTGSLLEERVTFPGGGHEIWLTVRATGFTNTAG